MSVYVVATMRQWNIKRYLVEEPTMPGEWHLVAERLDAAWLKTINPRYIFFPHWSDVVPPEIISEHECVCFHGTVVPYGRGGSPIQNLIARGHTRTIVSALRMTDELDAGPVYLRRGLCLQGLAEEVYIRAAAVIFGMIREIVATEPAPEEQQGEVTTFMRRTPNQSELPRQPKDLAATFDHIRMLDASGYPSAFITHGDQRMEFTRPALRTDHIEATVRITV